MGIKPWPSAFLATSAAWALAAGCATSRLISSPGSAPAVEAVAKSKHAGVKVTHAILPNGAGSWVKGAKWLEFPLEIRNLGGADLTIASIRLIDSRGVYVGQNYSSVAAIEAESASLGKELGGALAQTYGLELAGTLAGSAMANAAVATGSYLPIPGISTVLSVVAGRRATQPMKDMAAIEAEFSRRRLSVPLEMAAAGEVSGSAFFPLVPGVRALVMSYMISGKQDQVKIDMTEVWGQLLRKRSKATEQGE